MKARQYPFSLFCILLVTAAGTAWAVQVQAQADRSRPIYAGSHFAYSIIIADGPQPQSVDLGPLKAYSPSGPSTQNRTSIVNGRSSSYQILTYQLLAPARGDFTLPSVNVTIDGKVYPTNPVEISVVEPGTTNQIDLEMELSASACYVRQPVLLRASFYVWVSAVQAEQIANIDLRIPILEDERFYTEDSDTFRVTNPQSVLPVNGHNEPVMQDQVLHQGVNCLRVRLVKVLIPKSAGTFSLAAGSVSADLAVGQKSRGGDRFFGDFFGPQYEYQRYRVQSKPLELAVQPLPQAGKPDDFYGLVGRYSITADASPKEVNVGDPITLTIRISGGEYLKPVQWPDLNGIFGMAESFRIPAERSDGEIRDKAKIFTQTLRPNSADVTKVPPIPLSFFDAEAGQYRTVYTEPIALKVSPTRIVTGKDIVSGNLQTAPKTLQAVQEGLSANYTSADVLTNERFAFTAALLGPTFVFLYALPLAVLLAGGMFRCGLSDNPQRQAAARRRRAYRRAVKAIRHAARRDKPSRHVLAVLRQYAADHFGRSDGALTAQDCGILIREKTGDALLASRYQELMEQAEASEYSSVAVELKPETQREILELLAQTEKKLR